MNCNVIKDLLPLYVDEVLSEDSKALVEAHLADCPDCNAALEALQTQQPMPETPDISAKQAMGALGRLMRKRIKLGAILAAALCVALIWGGQFLFGFLFLDCSRPVPTSAIHYELTRTEAGRVVLGWEIDQNVFKGGGGWSGNSWEEDGQMMMAYAPMMPILKWPFGNIGDWTPSTLAEPNALDIRVENGTLVSDWNDTPVSKLYLGWQEYGDEKVIWQEGDPLPPLCTPEQQNWIRHYRDDADQSQDADFG